MAKHPVVAWKRTIPRQVISPGSAVRLTKLLNDEIPAGTEFRIGYYSRHDGLNVVWLVDKSGEYVGTVDQGTILTHFEVVTPSDDQDHYGLHREVLQPIL